MAPFATWAFLALIIERAVELILKAVPGLDKTKLFGTIDAGMLLSLVIALLFSYGADLNFFAMFDIPFSVAYAGPACTALFMAGGAEIVHSVISLTKNTGTSA